jgi:flagellar biosynthesis protein FlhB
LFRQCGIDQAIPTEHFAEVGTIYRGVMKRPGSRVRS